MPSTRSSLRIRASQDRIRQTAGIQRQKQAIFADPRLAARIFFSPSQTTKARLNQA